MATTEDIQRWKDSIRRWRERSEECRTKAEDMWSALGRESMQRVVEGYEKMIRETEERLLRED